MNMEKITNMLFPVIISAIAWLLTAMSSIQADLINIKSKMPILITEQGVPTDSPISAEQRGKLKEELRQQISELNVRIRILEEHDMQRKNK
jgi:predicted amino acid-binding ACT domain protein